MTSKRRARSTMAVTVRSTPSTAMLSPGFVWRSTFLARTLSSPPRAPTTSPASSMIPVNTRFLRQQTMIHDTHDLVEHGAFYRRVSKLNASDQLDSQPGQGKADNDREQHPPKVAPARCPGVADRGEAVDRRARSNDGDARLIRPYCGQQDQEHAHNGPSN